MNLSKQLPIVTLVLSVFLINCFCLGDSESQPQNDELHNTKGSKPHVIIIMADDMVRIRTHQKNHTQFC